MGLLNAIKNFGKNTLYYPGCLSKYVLKQETENYKKILNKINAKYIVIQEEMCCSSPVLNAGYETEAIKLARKNLEIFRKYSVGKIITNCPACYKTFKYDYKKLLPDWDIEVEHITETILAYLKRKKIDAIPEEDIAYHDPCHLGRHSEIYEQPREILKRLGYNVKEMINTKENSLCCGAGAGLKTNNPELANKIAKERIKQAVQINVKKIITTCPLCYAHILENSNIVVEEFSHVVARGLRINPEKTDLNFSCKTIQEACS